MKADSHIQVVAAPSATANFGAVATRLQDYWALSKPRVTALVWASTLAGMVLAGGGPAWLFLHTLVGSWLVIAGANALNQVLEVGSDAGMQRTANRPLPAGRLSVNEGLAVGIIWSALGLAQLALFVNALTAALAAASIALYVFGYTPLKRRTHLCTIVGAIPGAIPPLAGWAAVRNEVAPAAALLFAIQLFWQFPHFWAIAWLNREEYAPAGFRMLPFPGADGRATGLCALQYALLLLPLSLAFTIYVSLPVIYALGASALGLWMAGAAARFWRAPTDLNARRLMRASVIYLPLLLLLMVVAR